MPPIRVLSIPSAHDYVRHLQWPGVGDDIVRLPDVPPPGADAEQWWPPPGLSVAWLRRHRPEIDLVHVHFGFESFGVAELGEWVAVMRAMRVPLILTVHDLSNPHLLDQRLHLAQLDVLIPAADVLITLTDCAARHIERRWGRRAQVLPHPHLLPLHEVGLPRKPRERLVVGVMINALRANLDPIPVVAGVLQAAEQTRRLDARVHVHPAVLTSTDRRAQEVTRWLSSHLRPPQLQVHPRLPPAGLRELLYGLDLMVLPYRHGTHSGWIEACVDAGTRVLVPEHGCFWDQHPCQTYRVAGGSQRIADDVQAALASPAVSTTAADRAEQRRALARAHTQLYRSAVTR